MNALLISYALVSAAVVSVVMFMLLWAAVADGRAASEHRIQRNHPAPRHEAVRPPNAMLVMAKTGHEA
jgi:hypothetical protein